MTRESRLGRYAQFAFKALHDLRNMAKQYRIANPDQLSKKDIAFALASNEKGKVPREDYEKLMDLYNEYKEELDKLGMN